MRVVCVIEDAITRVGVPTRFDALATLRTTPVQAGDRRGRAPADGHQGHDPEQQFYRLLYSEAKTADGLVVQKGRGAEPEAEAGRATPVFDVVLAKVLHGATVGSTRDQIGAPAGARAHHSHSTHSKQNPP